MAPATIRILHRSMTVTILIPMPMLRAFRAIIVLLGFLAVAPAQAVGALSEANAVISMTCQGGTTRSGARRDTGFVLGVFQFGTNCPDDGCSANAAALPPPTDRTVEPTRFAEPPFRHTTTHFRLDRPPKFA